MADTGSSVGGYASGIGGVVTGLVGAGVARQNTERSIIANKNMAEYAYSKDLEMWNRQNAYNTPQAQMARIRAAGLNPNLVYGTGVTGNTSAQMPKYQAPTVEYRNENPLQGLPGGIQGYLDARFQNQQIDLLRSQVRNVDQRTSSEAINTALLTAKLSMSPDAKQLLKTAVDQAKFNLDNAYGLRSYQFSMKEQQARQADIATTVAGQKSKLLGKDILTREEELKFMQNRNKLSDLGVYQGDNAIIRMLIQAADKAGISFSEWLSRLKK